LIRARYISYIITHILAFTTRFIQSNLLYCSFFIILWILCLYLICATTTHDNIYLYVKHFFLFEDFIRKYINISILLSNITYNMFTYIKYAYKKKYRSLMGYSIYIFFFTYIYILCIKIRTHHEYNGDWWL
jgi:hypothetical protein